ncbi:MAG: AAA domain-containing protein [Bacteroidota bacterium]
MSKSEQHNIKDLADEIRVFSRNDVLVNISKSPVIVLEADNFVYFESASTEINRIAKFAQQTFKESGTQIFCVSEGVLHWEWKGKACASPVLLCPAALKYNKIKQEYKITFDSDDAFINPFLIVEFQKIFDFVWPELDFQSTNWENIEGEMQSLGFSIGIESTCHYGNFHHHRYNVLRDVEFLENINYYSPPLNQILQIQDESKVENLDLTDRNLFPADINQGSVFSEIQNKNLVVQGPPGTGKSQVISNIIGKLMHNQNSTLVVSEKRVALEVLKNKLADYDLDKFCFLPNAGSIAHDLIQQLKQTWLFLESTEQQSPFQLNLSREKKSALQFKLDIISKNDLIGGVGFSHFQILSEKHNLSTVSFNIQTAGIDVFLSHQSTIRKIYETDLFSLLSSIPYRTFTSDSFDPSIRKIENLEKKFHDLNEKFTIENIEDLLSLMKRASFAQLIANESQKDYYPILKPTSTDRKKFKRLSKKYFVLKKGLEQTVLDKKNWQILPTKIEAFSLLSLSRKSTFFQKLRLKKRMNQLLVSKHIPFEKALSNWLDYLKKEEQFQQVEKQLLEIGVATESEIDWLKTITPKINEEEWRTWSSENIQENKKLADCNAEINTFFNDQRTYLKLDNDVSFDTFFKLFKSHLPELVAVRESIISLPEQLYNQVGKHKSFEELEKEILKSSWIQFVGRYPSFENFKWENLSENLDEIIQLQKVEAKDFSHEIIVSAKKKFNSLNNLLNTATRKLSENDKLRKATLKKGRSILVKEFAKTRSHPTIRELLDSPASEWITCLLPIWMANPSQVADFFPLEKEQFDMVLFDEATQISLVNSLGALYRSKRSIVVGDEQQMTPTSFFKAGESEPIDLLHQAKFTWDKVMLKHHYRSQHPDLIAFSNKYFYDNELIAFPSAKSVSEVISWHYVPDGRFIDRENVEEAKRVAKFVELLLSKSDTLGIVAFSETQLSCIYNQLSSISQRLLDDRIEQNTCFFRALENIQGDECDHLVVSLGYGLNEEDKLLLNFGPLNRKSGRRRLNVLFSRAKKKIDFFSSIESKDLILSTNDSLNLLRQFFLQLENKIPNANLVFPYNLDVSYLQSDKLNMQTVNIQNITSNITDVNELLTLHQVLSERNWDVRYS